MKSKLFFVILFLSIETTLAQLPTGSWYTGACIDLGFSSSDDGTNKSNNFLLFPATYYTLNQNWGVGGGISYNTMTSKYTGNPASKTTTSSYFFEPGARYYGKLSDRVNCYFGGNLNVGGGTTKTDYDGNVTKTNNSFYGINAHPGIMWNIKERTYLDFSYGSLDYLHTTYKNKDADTKSSDSSFDLNLNMWTLGVGLYYTFGKTQ